MPVSWWTRLTETEEEKRLRQIEELKGTDEFKDMMQDSLREAFTEFKAEEQRQAEEEKRQYQEKIDKAKLDIKLVGESMKDSPEPFCNVLAMGFSKENGLSVKLDFNDAFIRFLNALGIKAENDEETVRIYLAHLADDILREEQLQDYVLNGVSDDEKPAMSYEEMMKEMNEDDDGDESGDRWEQPTS